MRFKKGLMLVLVLVIAVLLLGLPKWLLVVLAATGVYLYLKRK